MKTLTDGLGRVQICTVAQTVGVESGKLKLRMKYGWRGMQNIIRRAFLLHRKTWEVITGNGKMAELLKHFSAVLLY